MNFMNIKYPTRHLKLPKLGRACLSDAKACDAATTDGPVGRPLRKLLVTVAWLLCGIPC